ncbi:MAG: GIY-YIG nuclease family protein [Nitrospirota bacterium]
MAKKAEKGWSLYMLRCRDRTLYTGITNDIARRLLLHKKGIAARYTRGRLPVKLVHQEPCGSRSDALKKEHALKKLKRAEKEAYIKNYGSVNR